MRRHLVLGIDPSINMTGYGLIDLDGPTLLSYGTWKTGNKKGDLPSRMQTLVEVIEGWFESVSWNEVGRLDIAIEMGDWWKPGRKNIKELMKLMYATGWLTAHLRERIEQFGLCDVKAFEVPVSSWKGRISKAETAAMVDAVFGRKLGKMSDHASDAIGIALWHESQMRLEKAVI